MRFSIEETITMFISMVLFFFVFCATISIAYFLFCQFLQCFLPLIPDIAMIDGLKMLSRKYPWKFWLVCICGAAGLGKTIAQVDISQLTTCKSPVSCGMIISTLQDWLGILLTWLTIIRVQRELRALAWVGVLGPRIIASRILDRFIRASSAWYQYRKYGKLNT